MKVKRIYTIFFVLVMVLALTACGDSSKQEEEVSGIEESSTISEENVTEEKNDDIPDLIGEWTQVNGEDDEYQWALISDDTIVIYNISNGGDTKSLYWYGSFKEPTTGEQPYSWESQNNHDRTNFASMASSDDTITFSYENGQITYQISSHGTTTTYRLEKSGELTDADKEEISEVGLVSVEEIVSYLQTDFEDLLGEIDDNDDGVSDSGIFLIYDNTSISMIWWMNGIIDEIDTYRDSVEYKEQVWDVITEAILERHEEMIEKIQSYGRSDLDVYVYIVENADDLENAVLVIKNGEIITDAFASDNDIPSEKSSDLVDGMRPEFKAAMDAYVEFFDEYCDFIEKYSNSDGTDLNLMHDYIDYLDKYAKMLDEMDAWEDEDLNDTELKYYLEISGQIMEKLVNTTNAIQ